MKRISLVFFCAIVFFACQQAPENENVEVKEISEQLTLVIQDSFTIAQPQFFIADYQAVTKTYVGYNIADHSMSILNDNFEVILSANRYGEGAGEHRRIYDTFFYNDSLIAVSSYGKLFFFDKNLHYFSDITISRHYPNTYKRRFKRFSDSSTLIVFQDLENEGMQFPRYYDLKHISVADKITPDTFNYHSGIDYPEEIKLEKFAREHGEQRFSFKSEKKLDVVIESSPNLYRYDLTTHEYTETIPIDFSNFNFDPISQVPRGKEQGYYQSLPTPYQVTAAVTPEISFFHSYSATDYLLTYRAALSKEEAEVRFDADNESLSSPVYGRYDYYAAVFDKDEPSEVAEVKLPAYFGDVQLFRSESKTLIFKKIDNEKDEAAASTTFYVVKIEK